MATAWQDPKAAPRRDAGALGWPMAADGAIHTPRLVRYSGMKSLLLLGLLFALPAIGFAETTYSTRTYRGAPVPVQRVTTVRTTTYPSVEVYRSWDRGQDYLWNEQRYHWDGAGWIVLPRAVYSYRGGGYGPSSTLQDDVGLDSTREEVRVAPTVTRVERVDVGTSTLAIDVQRRLARRGYYHGLLDGIVGPETRSAIASFQADHGQRPDGMITQQVVSSLGL